MLRTKLLVAFLGVLAPTLLMASLLYWVPRQIEQHVARSLIDRDQIQLFLETAFQTTRELQWLSYHVALGEPVPEARVLAARRRLDGQLSAMRQVTARDLARLDDDDQRTGEEEVERIDQSSSWQTPGSPRSPGAKGSIRGSFARVSTCSTASSSRSSTRS